MSKFLTYAQAHADRQMRERFGWGSFRVLVVTTEERASGLEHEIADRLGAARQLVRACTIDDVLASVLPTKAANAAARDEAHLAEVPR